MFLDASVIVVNLLEEREAIAFRSALAQASENVTSPLAIFEASTRIAAVKRVSIDKAYEIVRDFIEETAIRVVAIDAAVGAAAHLCAAHYHYLAGYPARLNVGDCFAYAAARASGVPLAYKGNDFVHTDIDGIRFGA